MAAKKRAPTLAPGDGRKRDWPAILSHIELEWVTEKSDCDRSANKDGDTVAFKHKGFIAELPKGKTRDAQGHELQVGMQMDSNILPETKEDKPLEFMLGTPKLIVGMEAVLRTMCENEKVRAKIPGPLAYNSRAGFLPYDTVVLYEMEMVQVTRGNGLPAPESPTPMAPVSAGAATWKLVLALLTMLGLVFGGIAFLMRGGEKSLKSKESKTSKKEGKKKR
ncbi:FKBP11 [Symbiodinium pilosum]|uniref:peptidylprolyl isomerase n=1 Tax=Symbiodinium pilosum TaxID=2952 RepID=A0A812TEB8_SYMPI|nr:FKBP11 [Symbiodinium pilosum]